ncbi:type II secretion system protein [Sulfuricurvum sp.]|uniref:type II secretion system protein n=1 Tax=Sulfuricurvum sp. TaxID=2025608 RepID=UPI00261EBB80|nr:type II secretion system protein [Sulfuricurvum sp.]MDD2265964.1 type II secretion system protein [Sulfuricurvum sp.]MDD2783478.1 type II secretion system protein [Sulfuricurvum sp.]
MKRSGFTMIELIFVIVILGILAAVAIPRLAATRDDAKIATKVQEGTAVITEFGSYYTAHGHFAKVSDMTNVKLTTSDGTSDAAAADMNQTDLAAYLTDGQGNICISYKTLSNSLDGNLTVKSESSTSAICDGIRKSLNDKNISSAAGITHKLGGSNVEY